jgi:phosphoesterase RecJ-like protein
MSAAATEPGAVSAAGVAGCPSAVQVDEASWARAVSMLRAARSVVLVCHVAPDGDALGSMLALSAGLRAIGARTTCSWGDEQWRVPPSYSWLPGVETVVPPAEVEPAPDLMVVLDTGSRDRLGVLAPLARAAGGVLVVDHHAHNAEPVEGTHLVDPAAAATVVVVEELLRRLDVAVDEAMATCLYTGLVTDTGSFAHAVTTPAVHAVAARLLTAGARPDVVHRELWGTRPLGFVRMLATALARVRLEPAAAGGRGLVWTFTTTTDVREAGIDIEQVDGVMETIRQTAEADVAAVLKQDADGSYRVSTRSRGGSDVGAACASLGGGGHRLAAGFTSGGDVEEVVADLMAALDR